MEELHERAVRAARAYLERKGCRILCTSWTGDGGVLVFAQVAEADTTKGFPRPLASRAGREVAAVTWLAERGDGLVDRQVRFDDVSLMVVGDAKAFLRHHINALEG